MQKDLQVNHFVLYRTNLNIFSSWKTHENLAYAKFLFFFIMLVAVYAESGFPYPTTFVSMFSCPSPQESTGQIMLN